MSESITTKKELTLLIKRKAEEMGFFACGMAHAEFLEVDKNHFENWLGNSNHGEMKFLERHREVRYDPRKIIEGTRSVISVLQNYYPEEIQDKEKPRIAKYAYGSDYHHVIKKKLLNVIELIRKNCQDAVSEAFVDSAPIFEKRWAQKAGLGWIGKNSILINSRGGSFFYLGVILTTAELDYDQPEKEQCGNCTNCLDACPAGALNEPFHINARKCIAYLTIEHKGAFGPDVPQDFKNYIYGCDICQDACPWNRFAKPMHDTAFSLNSELLNLSFEGWNKLDNEAFSRIAGKSCLQRTGLDRMKRNVQHVIRHEQ
jgi:epoxyqueuosine reductase